MDTYLQQTIDYFNDRFEQERHFSYRPFILEGGVVSGLFGPTRKGPARISSAFAPIHQVSANGRVIGHLSACSVTHYDDDFQQPGIIEIGDLLAIAIKQPVGFQPIINLDRLCRTVHLLNYLPAIHSGGRLILEVDPRHILGIKRGHGSYFEELLVKCGLGTGHIVISMTVDTFYARHPVQLLEGLNNYRQRGYQIAINIGHLYRAHDVQDLITKLSPNYLRVSAPDLGDGDPGAESARHAGLGALKQLMDAIGGQTILRQQDSHCASRLGFGLLQGDFIKPLGAHIGLRPAGDA